MPLTRQSKIAILKVAEVINKIADLRDKLVEDQQARIARIRDAHFQELESSEKKLIEALEPFFLSQGASITDALSRIEEGPVIGSMIFEPSDWHSKLIDAALPVLAETSAQAMINELSRLGVDFDDYKKKSVSGSDWLDEPGDSPLEEISFVAGAGEISMGFLRQYPSWMQQAIRANLEETFAQDYWKDINETTLRDINLILQEGAIGGQSIRDIAKSISQKLSSSSDYVIQRARNIARTEMGHALNGARSMAMDALIEEAGVDVPMKKQWLSILSDTTRDTHAHLDGVPSDEDDRWYLGGVYCRWPGDVVLPARERCNCQCSLVLIFGMTEVEARELIGQYTERIATKKSLKSLSQHTRIQGI